MNRTLSKEQRAEAGHLLAEAVIRGAYINYAELIQKLAEILQYQPEQVDGERKPCPECIEACLGEFTDAECKANNYGNSFAEAQIANNMNALRRAKLLPKPKTLEDRVTIEPYPTADGWSLVKVDGITQATVCNCHAANVRDCLIAKLREESR